jgi:hypothetical protein
MRSKSWAAVSLAVSLAFGVSGCRDAGKIIGEDSGRSGQEARRGGPVVESADQEISQVDARYGVGIENMRKIACFLFVAVDKGVAVSEADKVQRLREQYGISEYQAGQMVSEANSKEEIYQLGAKLFRAALCRR